MKKCRNTLMTMIAIVVCLLAVQAHSELNVVCTLPDLAAVAREIGGDHVEITTLAKPTEDPHYVDPRPSFMVKLNGTDALIEGGADLEAGWLPPLVQGSRNPKIQKGGVGRVVASRDIQLLGIPDSVSRAGGDIHARGNPHFMVDPERAKAVAGEIAAAFCALDPESRSYYENNLKTFNAAVDAKLKEWKALLAPFKGRKVAAYHDGWIYFGSRFGLDVDLFLEPKPGIPPSPSHLEHVINAMKNEKVEVILVEPFQDRKVAESVASHTGAQVVDAAQFPGAIPGTDTYMGMMDHLVSATSKAMATGR